MRKSIKERMTTGASHEVARNYAIGQDNPVSGGPGDTPKRQSGRQSPIGRPITERGSAAPNISAARDAYVGSHNPGRGTIPGPDRMGSGGD